MTCDCAASVNEKLVEHNAVLDRGLLIDRSTGTVRMAPPALSVSKLDPKKRGRLPTLYCAFCPFCGEEVER